MTNNLCCLINPLFKCARCGYKFCRDCHRDRKSIWTEWQCLNKNKTKFIEYSDGHFSTSLNAPLQTDEEILAHET